MDKEKKIMWFLGIAVVLDIITTYVFLNYFPNLKEGNSIILSLNSIHHLLVFAYIPFIILLCDAILHWCKKIGFYIEARTIVLFIALWFLWSTIYNIIMMLMNL